MNIKSILKIILPKFILEIRRKVIKKIKVNDFLRIQKAYPHLVEKLRQNVSENQKIRVGFYVVYDASWGARPVFEKMLTDDFFEPKIVVCPDIARGIENQNEVLNKVYSELVSLYGKEFVILSYDKNRFVDYSDFFDIISVANPYDLMTYKYYRPSYLAKKKKLVIYNSYFYTGKLKYDINVLKSDSYNYFWKFFVDNEFTKKLAIQEQYIKGSNTVVSGCCKMDKFNDEYISNNYQKTILIAPHHTVRSINGYLNLSNFMRYHDLFLRLPAIYPNVKFIFRPHPLMFTTLRAEDLWGNEKVDNYISKLNSIANMEYSTSGEYFDVFNESDALIHDCGSFLAEYFYTGKPQCYLLQNDKTIETEYIEFGKRMLEHTYKAYSEQDIINFIDKVVLESDDYMKDERDDFSKSEIMVNYPNASQFEINYIKNLFCV